MQNKITVIGLGYVGLTLAITLAKKGFITNGVERDKKKFSLLSKNRSHFHEDNIEKQLKIVKRNKTLKIFNNLKKTNNSNVYVITIGTPINEKKKNKLRQHIFHM